MLFVMKIIFRSFFIGHFLGQITHFLKNCTYDVILCLMEVRCILVIKCFGSLGFCVPRRWAKRIGPGGHSVILYLSSMHTSTIWNTNFGQQKCPPPPARPPPPRLPRASIRYLMRRLPLFSLTDWS